MDTRQRENFHIYLLMGQSNMAGRGVIEPIDTITDPRVLVLNKDDRWVLAKNPLHFDKPIAGTGLGLTFGKMMAQANDQVTIGLIPCAKGGSSINQWFPDSLHPATNSYPYLEMIEKSKKVLPEGTIKGILWHQGESDTQSAEDIASYAEKFITMISLLKSGLNLQTVPIAMGELGVFFTQNNPLASELNDVFRQLANQSECIELVTAEGLQHKGDTVHFDSDSYRLLGERYAKTMIELQKRCPSKSAPGRDTIQSKL
jgi:hypothetical protein